MRRIGLASSILLACATSPVFAGILVVDAANGPGTDFTNLQAAAVAASGGDTLLVRAGTYAALDIGSKSLLVVGDTGAAVNVASTIRVHNLAANQFVLLRGIDGTGVNSVNVTDNSGIVVESVQGSVWLDDCVFAGVNGYSGMRQADASVVAAHRTQFIGGDVLPQFYSPWHGGYGAIIYNNGPAAPPTRFRTWDSTFHGGRGGDGGTQWNAGGGGQGIYVSGGADVRLESVTSEGGVGGDQAFFVLFQGYSAGWGGNGMYVESGQNTPLAVKYRDAVFKGGLAGHALAPGVIPGVDGKPIVDSLGISALLPGTTRHYDVTSPGRAGSTVGLTFAGLPNDVVFLFAGAGPAAQLVTSPAIDGPLVLPLPLSLLVTIPLGPSGQFAAPVAIPQLPPGIDTVTVWTQALFVSGNTAVAANGNAITLLAAGF